VRGSGFFREDDGNASRIVRVIFVGGGGREAGDVETSASRRKVRRKSGPPRRREAKHPASLFSLKVLRRKFQLKQLF
jgi:hypothetical protein